jgi:hypothetical protein
MLALPGISETRLSSAIFDPSGCFRYLLVRQWNESKPSMCWVLMNPSTADAAKDDPTIRRCMAFARSWGYGRMEVVNLFAFRATSPREMMREMYPEGPANDAYIRAAAERAQRVVVGWGTHGGFRSRDREVLSLIGSVETLGVTKDGFPRHPLYVRSEAVLERFDRRAR